MATLTEGRMGYKTKLICSHKGKNGHIKEQSCRIIGFLANFKFIKNKMSAKKMVSFVNSVITQIEKR